MKTTAAGQCDLNSAVNAARAFWMLAKPYLAEVPREHQRAEDFVRRTLGAFTAAATNVTLSVELLLKAESIRCKFPVLHTHDLRNLFDHLPQTSQNQIEQNYDAAQRSDSGISAAMEIAVTRKPIQPKVSDLAVARKSLVSVKDLRSLLSAECDAFETWRYFFSEGPVGPVVVFQSHFRSLDILAEVLYQHIREASKTKMA